MTERVAIEKSKVFFVIPKTILVIPYPYNYLVSYPLSLKLFCQLSLIPRTPNRASVYTVSQTANVFPTKGRNAAEKLSEGFNDHFSGYRKYWLFMYFWLPGIF